MAMARERHEKQLSQNFAREVKARVNGYFEQNRLSRHANAAMVVKTVVLVVVYFGSYGLIVSGLLPLPWMWFLCFVMGIGMAGIGFSVTHDALHGAYSASPRVNRLIGCFFDTLGANGYIWNHPQRDPPYLYQHPRLRRGPRGLAADPPEPAHAVQEGPPVPAPVRVPRLQHGDRVLGVRQGLQVLPAARSRALSRQEASAVRMAVPQQSLVLFRDDRGAAARARHHLVAVRHRLF